MENKSLSLQESISERLPDLSNAEFNLLLERLESGIVKVGISAELADKWYALYLTGYSYAEIQKSYPLFVIQDILWAAHKFNWYASKIDQMMASQKRVSERLQQSRFEQVDLLLDKLKATEIFEKEALKKFIADPKNVAEPSGIIKNPRQLKETIEAIEKLVNLGKPIQHEINVNINKTKSNDPPATIEAWAKEVDEMTEEHDDKK